VPTKQEIFDERIETISNRLLVIQYYHDQPDAFRATYMYRPTLLAGKTPEANYNASKQVFESDERIQKLGLTAKFLDDMHYNCMGQSRKILSERITKHYKYISDCIKLEFERQVVPKLPPGLTEDMRILPENYCGPSTT